jgi:hypothetical protein
MKPTSAPKHSANERQNLGAPIAEWEGLYNFNYRTFSLSLIQAASPSEPRLKLQCCIGEGARRAIPYWQAHTVEFDINEALLFLAQTATSCSPAHPVPRTSVIEEFSQNQNIVLRSFLRQVDTNGVPLVNECPEFTLALAPSFRITAASNKSVSLFPAKRPTRDGPSFEYLLSRKILIGDSSRSLYVEQLISIEEAAELFAQCANNL